MALIAENIIRIESINEGKFTTIVWDNEKGQYYVCGYDGHTFGTGRWFKEQPDANIHFVNWTRRIKDAARLEEVDGEFTHFFCETQPDLDEERGKCCMWTIDQLMGVKDAQAYLEAHECLNPDNGKRLVRVRFPMLWSEELGKFVFYEAALAES